MNIELLTFVISVFSTFFVLSILWYAQFSAYPQFKWIPEQDFIALLLYLLGTALANGVHFA